MKLSALNADGTGAKAPTTIFVMDGDRALSYLLERYSGQAGLCFGEVHGPWTSPTPSVGSAVLWLPSIERLAAETPRERGVGDDMPVIVCSFVGDEARARELGADFCAYHPLRYRDFLAALHAVGVVEPGSAEPGGVIADQRGPMGESGPAA